MVIGHDYDWDWLSTIVNQDMNSDENDAEIRIVLFSYGFILIYRLFLWLPDNEL